MPKKKEVPKYKNLSDGVSDGIVLFYMKNKMLYPVMITKDQVEMLDLIIAVPFKESKLVVAPTPVEYDAIKEMIIE